MLLTAQRVVSPVTHKRGVNVYKYLHGPYTWERVPDGLVPEANPGELVAHWIELAPGGNRVVSFLDVVAPDEIQTTELQQRMASLKSVLRPQGNPTIARLDPLWIRFGTAPSGVPWATELGALAGYIVLRLGDSPAR